jgi:hypothetical protein
MIGKDYEMEGVPVPAPLFLKFAGLPPAIASALHYNGYIIIIVKNSLFYFDIVPAASI